MENFIREILQENGFKESYVELLILDKNFITDDDREYFCIVKGHLKWKTRLFSKLKFKSFTKQGRNYWIYRGYSELEARDLSDKNMLHRNKPTPMQKEFWIEKGMSEDEAIFKIKSSRKTQVEYWISRGYTEKETAEKIREYQLANSEKLKEKKRISPELFHDVSWNQKKYWIRKGLNDDEAVKKVSKMQETFSLRKCIEKHGDKGGKEIWSERNKKWRDKVYNSGSCISRGTSEMSSNFINEIMNNIDFIGTFLFDKNEKFIYSKELNKAFKYDFTYNEKKKIIEINGDFWHANPKFFKNKNDIHRISKKTVSKIWELDEYKIRLADEYGYSVLTIWEDDIRNNRKYTINKCINFLKENNENRDNY